MYTSYFEGYHLPMDVMAVTMGWVAVTMGRVGVTMGWTVIVVDRLTVAMEVDLVGDNVGELCRGGDGRGTRLVGSCFLDLGVGVFRIAIVGFLGGLF